MTTIPQQALNQHIAVLGKTGSGKTYAAKAAIVEPLLSAGGHVCVIDPTGAWWGLRSGRDGKPGGFERVIILGGRHGDIPLPPLSGKAVAQLVVTQGASIIADVSDMGVGERSAWWIDFATELYKLARSPLHVVIDEAHMFAPQGKVPDPQTGKMLHATNTLFSGGRSRGLRMVAITQRPAKFHKDSLTSVDTLVSMKMLAPQDRQAVKDWIDGCGDAAKGKEVLDSLAQLQKGEGWVWYPEGGYLQRVVFPRITTYDSSATPTEQERRHPPKLSVTDLAKVKESMAQAVQEAEASDPKKLRARIAELERAAKPAPTPQPCAECQDLRRTLTWIKQSVSSKLAGLGEQIAQFGETLTGEVPTQIPHLKSAASRARKPGAESNRAPARGGAGKTTAQLPDGLSGPQRECLSAFAWFKAIGINEPTKDQICFKCGWRSTSGHIKNVLGALRSAGLVDGMRLVADVPAPEIGTLADYHDQIRGTLTGPQAQVFDLMLDKYPAELSKELVCKGLGWSVESGHIKNVIGAMRSFGIVEPRGWALTDMVFPEGLAG